MQLSAKARSSLMPCSSHRSQYREDGFTVIPDIFPTQLLEDARVAADRAAEKARDGRWTKVRRVGKQYPPFDKGGTDIW